MILLLITSERFGVAPKPRVIFVAWVSNGNLPSNPRYVASYTQLGFIIVSLLKSRNCYVLTQCISICSFVGNCANFNSRARFARILILIFIKASCLPSITRMPHISKKDLWEALRKPLVALVSVAAVFLKRSCFFCSHKQILKALSLLGWKDIVRQWILSGFLSARFKEQGLLFGSEMHCPNRAPYTFVFVICSDIYHKLLRNILLIMTFERFGGS